MIYHYFKGTAPPNTVVELNVQSEELRSENITVTLESTVENYVISIEPQVTIFYLGPTSVQLIISYNTLYNVSAVATQCGQNSSQVHFIELQYGESLSLFLVAIGFHLL